MRLVSVRSKESWKMRKTIWLKRSGVKNVIARVAKFSGSQCPVQDYHDYLRSSHTVTHFVSCNSCGLTEIYNLEILEGKDDLGTLLEVLFADQHINRHMEPGRKVWSQ